MDYVTDVKDVKDVKDRKKFGLIISPCQDLITSHQQAFLIPNTLLCDTIKSSFFCDLMLHSCCDERILQFFSSKLCQLTSVASTTF